MTLITDRSRGSIFLFLETIMGEKHVEREFDEQKLQAFMSAVLDDLRALDYMIDHEYIESGVRRMGAEQEMFLVDRHLRPAPIAVELLAGLDDRD